MVISLTGFNTRSSPGIKVGSTL